MKQILIILSTVMLFSCNKSDNNPITNPSGNTNTISFTLNGKSHIYTCPSNLITTGTVITGSIGTSSNGNSTVDVSLVSPISFSISGDKYELPVTGEYSARGGRIDDNTG